MFSLYIYIFFYGSSEVFVGQGASFKKHWNMVLLAATIYQPHPRISNLLIFLVGRQTNLNKDECHVRCFRTPGCFLWLCY